MQPRQLSNGIAQASEASRKQLRSLPRAELRRWQVRKLNSLLQDILPDNLFYQRLFGRNTLSVDALEQWSTMPLVCKRDIVANGSHDFAQNHTYASGEYTRLHRTSGTHGRPMIVMDTADDWQWWLDTWQYVWDVAEVCEQDTVFMAFSFGPFIGFWSAFEAATQRGLKVVPGGGLSTVARLDLMAASQATVLCCTPSYALHLAEEAARQHLEPSKLGIQKIVVAGEPGGSVPGIRDRIEKLWQARVIDHAGATEVGPWGVGSQDGRDLFVIESEFIAEFIPLQKKIDLSPLQSQLDLYELVLTALGRRGAPALRYRTGDVVSPEYDRQDLGFVRLRGGILGRADDMLIIRGVNVFPSSIETLLRRIESISEYRMIAEKDGAMDQLTIEIEGPDQDTTKIAEMFLVQLGLRVDVKTCPVGSLPRFEAKGQRFIDRRQERIPK